jgi:hypothetical protein
MTVPARRLLSAALLAVTLTFVLGGCASGYSTDLTPELDSYAHSSEQDYNRYARVTDNNTRQIWDDLANILLLNETSMLTSYPVAR